jgi:hypothetical protein
MAREPNLQPLRIPAHWKVTYNEFREADPGDDEAAMAYLCEDLLQVTCGETNVLVDLGWYPDGDPKGCYIVQAYRGDFHGEQLMHVEAADRPAAVRTLEDTFRRFQLR